MEKKDREMLEKIERRTWRTNFALRGILQYLQNEEKKYRGPLFEFEIDELQESD